MLLLNPQKINKEGLGNVLNFHDYLSNINNNHTRQNCIKL